MIRSLRVRVFLAQAFAVALALAIATALTVRARRHEALERAEGVLELEARRVAAHVAGLGANAPVDAPGLASEFAEAFGDRMTLMDAHGVVRGDSDVPVARLAALENHADRPEMREALAGRVGRAVRHSHTLGVDLVYVAVPGGGRGGIAVVRAAEPLARSAAIDGSLMRRSLAAAGVALLLSLPVVSWITGRQVSRIRALEATTRRLGAGQPGARAREAPADEVGRLGAAINQMADEGRVRLEALERERDERERILAHMSDGVALLDEAGRVVRTNRSLEALLGHAAPVEPGTSFAELVRSPELDTLLREAREGGRAVETELRLPGPRPRRVHAVATPMSGAGAGAVLLVARDLTEIERLNRVRQDFAANVSHELRTPLTSLRGYAEALLDGGLDDEVHREPFVRVIRDQTLRLEALVEDLLSLADLERPDAALRPEAVELRDLVERQLGPFRPRAARAGLALGLAPGPPVPVIADRARLEQVVANLVDNALKYTERGAIEVRVGGDQDRAWCVVTDSGQGIPAEDLPRIFERFYRVDKARSREKGGTGLGLSIVKHIVALHRGEVEVLSEPGAGSTFRFEIPARPMDRVG